MVVSVSTSENVLVSTSKVHIMKMSFVRSPTRQFDNLCDLHSLRLCRNLDRNTTVAHASWGILLAKQFPNAGHPGKETRSSKRFLFVSSKFSFCHIYEGLPQRSFFQNSDFHIITGSPTWPLFFDLVSSFQLLMWFSTRSGHNTLRRA